MLLAERRTLGCSQCEVTNYPNNSHIYVILAISTLVLLVTIKREISGTEKR